MPLIATPGDPTANSYLTVIEAQSLYFDMRLFTDAWDASADQDKALMMATRAMDMMLAPYKMFVPAAKGNTAYYITRSAWTGTPATATQALAWPRAGMTNRNGFPIDPLVIPPELKQATAELAGQLINGDRTLDSDIPVQGIKSVQVGSIDVSFDPSIAQSTKIIPDAVLFLLVPSWMSDELIEFVPSALFNVFV